MLVIGILAWQGWSKSSAAEPDTSAPGEPPPAPQRLEASEVPQRAQGERISGMSDPFFMAELMRLHAEEELARLGTGASAGSTANTTSDALSAPGNPAFRISLQSTMPGNPGRAWINGADVRVGEAVPGIDLQSPPRLVEVTSTSVVVVWGDQKYRIDLDGGAPTEVDSR